jgi:hypothetical protein
MKLKNPQDKVTIAIIIIIAILIAGLLSGCSSYLHKSKPIQVTHVLAVTEVGDTIKIPIESIKPNVIYNIIGYNYGRFNRFYRPYNYIYDYYPYNYSNTINNQGNSFGISTIRPTIQISVPTPSTSGSSGNTVATNPVTSTKGKKKNN